MFYIVELLNKLLNKYLINTKFPFIIYQLHTFLRSDSRQTAPIFNEKKAKYFFSLRSSQSWSAPKYCWLGSDIYLTGSPYSLIKIEFSLLITFDRFLYESLFPIFTFQPH